MHLVCVCICGHTYMFVCLEYMCVDWVTHHINFKANDAAGNDWRILTVLQEELLMINELTTKPLAPPVFQRATSVRHNRSFTKKAKNLAVDKFKNKQEEWVY